MIQDLKTLNDASLDIMRTADAVLPYFGYYVRLSLQLVIW